MINTREATNLTYWIGIDLYYFKWEYCEICIFWLQFEKFCEIVKKKNFFVKHILLTDFWEKKNDNEH